jgi:hypothetical protein
MIRFFFAYARESLPIETKLHVFVCQTFAHHSYPEFDQQLRDLRAVPLMHSIWAARTVLTAKELKDALGLGARQERPTHARLPRERDFELDLRIEASGGISRRRFLRGLAVSSVVLLRRISFGARAGKVR